MPTGKKLICSHCDYVIAMAPEGGLADADVICPNCGAELKAPGVIEETIDKVKDLLSGSGES